IPSALFAPAHLVTLFTLGLSSGLVLDCGYKEAVVVPVSEGYTLLNAWQAAQLGSETVYANYAYQGGSGRFSWYAFQSFVQLEIPSTARTCFVSPSQRAEEWDKWSSAQMNTTGVDKVAEPKVAEEHFVYPLNNLQVNKRLQVPSRLRELSVECLFRGDNDQITLASLLLKSLVTCPLDIRRTLATNIILIGGTVNIPGFAARLLEELDSFLELDEFSNLRALKGTFRIHQPPAEPNYVAWLGGAIFGALECLPGRSLERSAYLEKKTLPDWTSVIDTNPSNLALSVQIFRHHTSSTFNAYYGSRNTFSNQLPSSGNRSPPI
ncbi:actin-related protein 10, partial [Clonorchis sinensis]